VNTLKRLYGIATRVALLFLMVSAAILALAPHYDWAWHARAAIVSGVYRPMKFPSLAGGRDQHCNLADAWREAVPGSGFAGRRIDRSISLLQSDQGLELIGTPAGRFWIPAGDRMAVAEELAEQSEDEYGADQRSVRSGDIVLDVGANVGVFTRVALRRGASRVIAIEPAPWALECLRRNFAGEIGQGRVVIYAKGAWDRDDTLELTVAPGMATSSGSVAFHNGAEKSVMVPLTTIDKLVAELALPRIDFIKMDIEGAEPNALRGAINSVRRYHPRLAISLEHRPTDPDTIPALTRQLWPEYQIECGICANMREHLQPVVMFAR
jgi:FkbM family methyltransferase